MIVSITCRNGTEANISRSKLGGQLIKLSRYAPAITRAQVVFSREGHHKHSRDLVTCHMSISVPGKRKIDVYERQSSEAQAFGIARERAVKQLTRGDLRRKRVGKRLLSNDHAGDMI